MIAWCCQNATAKKGRFIQGKVCICMNLYTYTNQYIYHVYIYTWISIYINTWISIYIYIHEYLCIYIYTWISIYIYLYIYIHIYTHIWSLWSSHHLLVTHINICIIFPFSLGRYKNRFHPRGSHRKSQTLGSLLLYLCHSCGRAPEKKRQQWVIENVSQTGWNLPAKRWAPTKL